MYRIEQLVHGLAWIAALLFALTGIMLSYEVAARYFFIAPTIWAAELSQMALIWGSLIGMPWMLSARRHITVTAITSIMPSGIRRILELIAMFVVLVFSLIVMIWGWEIFYDSFVRGRTTGSLMNLPIWIVELSVPVGFALLSMQAIIEFIKVARFGAPEQDITHE